jgi:pimeloyl-ACP methyl ester carboxylesterase
LDFHHPYFHAAVVDARVRVIGIDRPGFGASDFQPRRRYHDWPGDVTAVADELGIERFGIIAYSAGGPYAVACALACPQRVSSIVIVSGVGPAETPNFHRGMGTTDTVMTRLSRWTPVVARLAIARARKQVISSPEKFSSQFDKELSPADLEIHRDPDFRQAVRNIFAESTRTGPRGVVEDYRVGASPSGLDYTAVAARVQMWHGDADGVVPLHHAEYVAGTMPTAELTVLPGVGHLHTPQRWREFVTVAAN